MNTSSLQTSYNTAVAILLLCDILYGLSENIGHSCDTYCSHKSHGSLLATTTHAVPPPPPSRAPASTSPVNHLTTRPTHQPRQLSYSVRRNCSATHTQPLTTSNLIVISYTSTTVLIVPHTCIRSTRRWAVVLRSSLFFLWCSFLTCWTLDFCMLIKSPRSYWWSWVPWLAPVQALAERRPSGEPVCQRHIYTQQQLW